MSGSRYHRIIYLPVLAVAIFAYLQFSSAAVDSGHSVKCTKLNPCHMQGYSCAFRHAGDSEGVCVSGQENGVGKVEPYEIVTQWPAENKGQQGTSPVVRTNDPPKTCSSCTLPSLPDVLFRSQPAAEISDAPFQPESEPSVDPYLASDAPDQFQSESTLSDTAFSPDSMNPKSMTVLEPPHENSVDYMRRLPSEVTTESREAASANTGNQHTDRKMETIKPAESRFQEIRRKQREVLETLMTQLAKTYGEQLGMVMLAGKREPTPKDVEGRKHREAELKKRDEHIHKETGLKETEGHIRIEAGLKETEGHMHRPAGLSSMMEAQNGKTDREKRFSEFENQEHIWDDIEEDWSDTWDVPEDDSDVFEDWSAPSDDDQNVYAPAEPNSVHSPGLDHSNGIHDTTYPLLEEPAYGSEEDNLLNGPSYDDHLDELFDGDHDMTERKKSSPTLGSRAAQLRPLLILTSLLIIIVAVI